MWRKTPEGELKKMTNNTWKSAALAVMLLMVMAAVLPAQTAVTTRVNVPFAFEAGGKTLAAGEYRLERAANANWVLYFYDVARNQTTTVATTPGAGQNGEASPKLVFQRAGASYCLTEVHVGGNSAGYRVPMTKEQALMAKAQNEKPIMIALLR